MAVDYESLIALEGEEKAFTYTDRDTMLYAIAVGMGSDPMDRHELPFVFERDLTTVPTMATVISWDDSLIIKSGLNLVMAVHGEQRITLHRPLPPAATILAKPKVVGAFDKGADKGAIVLIETAIRDQATGEPLCTLLSTLFARADGGFGGPQGSGPAPHRLPERRADAASALQTRPDQALIYRLCGDRNPLHADPEFAAAAGFPRPILHGLCTYGHACHSLLKEMCDYDAAAVTGFEARFTAPVFPGETIRTEMWRDDNVISFRSTIPERDVVALNNGKVTLVA